MSAGSSESGPPSPAWLDAYDFALPPERIAAQPVEPRDASRLLVVDRSLEDDTEARFSDLPQLLAPGDLLVVNETRVLAARLAARLERTGRDVEILLSHPDGAGWRALLGPSRRLRVGDRLLLTEGEGAWTIAELSAGGGFLLTAEGRTAEAMMDAVGHMPLPPYLHRADRPEDRTWYQTVYARAPGAIAAPTAGLHFTPELLAAAAARGVGLARVVLHVGLGTFAPVRAVEAAAHRVAPERFHVSPETLLAMKETRARGGRVVAVGTTTVRALESAARLAEQGAEAWTDLTITPGFQFEAVDAVVTNLHLPRSSLLVLISAFAGQERIARAYRRAIEAGFRFYSYGDAMLIL